MVLRYSWAMRRIFIAITCFAICGCAGGYIVNYGTKQLTQENIGKIIKGKTTKHEIESIFGQPISKINSSLGEMWTYSSSVHTAKHKNFVAGTTHEITSNGLSVIFDEKSIVKEFSTSEINPVVPVKMKIF